MSKTFLSAVAVLAAACLAEAQPAAQPAAGSPPAPAAQSAVPTSPDYTKRAAPLDATIRTKLVGRWTNSVDKLVIEITSIDPTTGQLRGKEWPTAGGSAQIHDLIGWVSAAPPRDKFDSVIPVTFSTTLYEYGTLPTWSGFLRDDTIVTMSYLVWPNRTYAWDHISTFQETWTKIP